MRYTDTVGLKFYADGTVRTFAGNTIICPTAPDTHAYQLAVEVQNRFLKLPLSARFSMLPASSLHMTVMDLHCEQVRNSQRWSRLLPLDASLEEQDQFFIKTVSQVTAPAHFRIRYKMIIARAGLTLELLPGDPETEAAIWKYRSDISEVTGVRHDDFETYQFHMSMAYKIIELEPEETTVLAEFLRETDDYLAQHFGIWETGSPELSFFDDMFRFVPVDQRNVLKTR